MKKIKKVLKVLQRKMIKLISYFDSHLYMKFYNKYLKSIGIDVGGAIFIHPSVDFDGRGYTITHIGKDVVISKNVLLLNHDYSIVAIGQ